MPMKKTEVMATAMEMARKGLGFAPALAIEQIAELIAQEDPADELYDSKVERLLKLAACIWSLRRDVVTPPGESGRVF
ncbi:hypothetical protein SAMN05443579_108104 [Variovorax sp. PDC80]|jgi:hypothetical protein|nr:MAG: hypothetical protein GAK39_04079 [Variovorax sp.]SFP03858.1 hypothetical protein SAMN05443579_108104 [Variovorax sp. PDC80]